MQNLAVQDWVGERRPEWHLLVQHCLLHIEIKLPPNQLINVDFWETSINLNFFPFNQADQLIKILLSRKFPNWIYKNHRLLAQFRKRNFHFPLKKDTTGYIEFHILYNFMWNNVYLLEPQRMSHCWKQRMKVASKGQLSIKVIAGWCWGFNITTKDKGWARRGSEVGGLMPEFF